LGSNNKNYNKNKKLPTEDKSNYINNKQKTQKMTTRPNNKKNYKNKKRQKIIKLF
jgi:hypothetical protein